MNVSKDSGTQEKTEKKSLLPTAKKPPVSDIHEVTFLIFGEKKIGKTSLCSKFENSLFLMFEPGGKGLDIYQIDLYANPIKAWVDFKKIIVELKNEPHQFKTVVIDTIDKCYESCFTWYCNDNDIDHPSEKKDFGASWEGIAKEFDTQLRKLLSLGVGVIFTSHATDKVFISRNSGEYNKLIPSMKKGAMAAIVSVVDVIGFYGYYGSERMLTIGGHEGLEAGNRLEERFIAKNGKRVISIPMGLSSNESFTNLVRAFNNQQEDNGESELEAEIETRKKPEKKKEDRGK